MFEEHALTHCDDFIRKCIGERWHLERLEVLLLALLRVAASELIYAQEAPEKVVINEYVTIAYSFFSGSEPDIVRAAMSYMVSGASKQTRKSCRQVVKVCTKNRKTSVFCVSSMLFSTCFLALLFGQKHKV